MAEKVLEESIKKIQLVTAGSKILNAINEVMKACPSVVKTGRNEFQQYNYASEADILTGIRGAMITAGLILIPSTTATETDQHGNTTIMVSYTLAHVSGEVWPEKMVVPGCGNDVAKNGRIGDKAIPKALTAANKYALSKLFQIATHDDPEKDETPESATTNIPLSIGPQPTMPVNLGGTPPVPTIASGTHYVTPPPAPFKSPAQESHEKVALGVQTVEAFLPLAKTALELDNYYIANKDTIEGHIKKVDPGAYKDLLDKFKKRKAELKA